METVIVSNSQFYSHYPRQIPKGSVNAEQVEIRLDKSWDGLTVFWHWKNLGTGVEKRDLLKDPAAPNTIPWEVLTDLGELRMGLVGLDGETVIKPTIWLTYGYVVEGVDPDAGSDPQPPTPSWEQQMVEQATQANQAAQVAQKAAEEAAESVASAGPYAEEAKKSAEAAKASQDAAATSAQQANEAAQTAQDAVGSIGGSVDRAEGAATEAGEAKQAAETAQAAASNSAGTAQGAATTASKAAQTAQEAATQAGEYLATVKQDANNAESAALEAGKSQEAARDAAQEAANARDQANTAATAADTAKGAAEQAATTAGAAQSGAAQSAQAAANSAQAAERAKQEAQNAAAAFPAPSPEVAGMVPMVNPEGNGYIFGGAGGKLIVVYVHQGNAEYGIESLDYETGVVQCPEAHGLSEPTKVMIVPNDWTNKLYNYAAPYIPVEWLTYTGAIYLLPVTETSFMVVGNDKETPITIDPDGEYNGTMDVTKLHFEAPVNWEINGIDKLIKTSRIHLSMYGFALPGVNRYTQVKTTPSWGNYVGIPALDTAVKSRYMLFSVVDVDVDIPNQGAGYYIGNTWAGGRRPDYPTGFWYTVQKEVGGVLGISKLNETERVINQIRNFPGYATWSNGSVIRVFATGVF